ncbi:MAG TPA: phosphoglycolate phosphatase [Burkholderiales bacterium]|nr:phosphoglycolate phosphatase [Burkholderiales bacterium]
MTVRAVLFDLDGTLLHTAPDLAAAANRMLGELGAPARDPAAIATYIGKGIPVLVHRTLTGALDGVAEPTLFARALPIFERCYAAESGARARPFEGVVEGLERMRWLGLALGCVTNKAGRFTQDLLARTGLARFFDCVVSGDTVARRKPDPLPLLHACNRLGARPDDTLVIGDSLNDVQAARAAGCAIWCVPYGYNEGRPASALDCDAVVPDLRDAARRIELLRAGGGRG